MSTYHKMRSIQMEVDRLTKKHGWQKDTVTYPDQPPTWEFVEAVIRHCHNLGYPPHCIESQADAIRDGLPRDWLVWLWYQEGYEVPDTQEKHYLDMLDEDREIRHVKDGAA